MAHTWVTFLGGGKGDVPAQYEDARVNFYKVRRVEGAASMVPGWNVARIEAADRVSSPAPVVLHGVVEHLHYTSDAERADLTARSRTELPPSEDTTAVLIPIRKSEDWWKLAQDHRAQHFHNAHTPVGARFVERIYRRLYHARYTGSAYDFLTYFEFPAYEEPQFQELLAGLRATEEWKYVEDEHEVWMTKLA